MELNKSFLSAYSDSYNAVYCDTEEELQLLIDKCLRLGIILCEGNTDWWYINEDDKECGYNAGDGICIIVSDNEWCDTNWCIESGYVIISCEDFIKNK